jgi:hypothetical protein
MRRGRMAVAAVVSVGAVAAGQWLGRTGGSTCGERRQLLPGDELVERPTMLTNHAVTITAPPEEVWPWLLFGVRRRARRPDGELPPARSIESARRTG